VAVGAPTHELGSKQKNHLQGMESGSIVLIRTIMFVQQSLLVFFKSLNHLKKQWYLQRKNIGYM
jgi:hypothetical protein